VHAELEIAVLGDDRAAPAEDLGTLPAPVEARLDAPAHVDTPGQTFDATRHFTPRQEPAALEAQCLGHADGAVLAAIRRLEHVRAVEVAALRVEAAGGLQHEAAAPLGIE